MSGFTYKQTEYLNKATHRWNVKSGATRSGKTYLDYYVIPKRIRRVANMDGLIVLLGNTKGTLQRNIIEPLQKIWGTQLVSDIRTDNTAILFGEKCYCLGADKVNQVDKIRGSSIKYCYGDEVVTWHQDVFEMLKSRLDKDYSKFDGTCNPDNPKHWFKTFIDSDADIYSQHYTIDDNTFLPKQVSDNLKKEYYGTVFYDRYILGKWKAAEGIIYRQFADEPDKFIIDKAPEIVFATIGVDFGGNKSAHAFVCNGFTKNMGEVITLDEFYLKEEISPTDLEKHFVEFVKRNKAKYNIYECFCDSAETTLIQGLRAAITNARIDIDVRKALKCNIVNRINFYNNIISHNRYKILKHCVNTIEALSTAVWDSKSITDQRLDDGSINIDSLDALEYTTELYQNDIIDIGVINGYGY